MNPIFVAIDGSEVSLHAARTAAEIASAGKAKLKLIHVLTPPFIPLERYGVSLSDVEAAQRKHAARFLKEAVEHLKSYNLAIDTEVLEADTGADALAAAAEKAEVEMIAVGTRGQGMVQRFLVGSFANRLLHVSTRPVLVVRA